MIACTKPRSRVAVDSGTYPRGFLAKVGRETWRVLTALLLAESVYGVRRRSAARGLWRTEARSCVHGGRCRSSNPSGATAARPVAAAASQQGWRFRQHAVPTRNRSLPSLGAPQ